MKKLLTVKVDEEIKDEAQRVAENLGLPLGTIINGYLRELIRTKSVSFTCGSNTTKTIGDPEKDTFRGVIIKESLQKKKTSLFEKVKVMGIKVKAVNERMMTPWLKKWSDYTIEIQGIATARKIAK